MAAVLSLLISFPPSFRMGYLFEERSTGSYTSWRRMYVLTRKRWVWGKGKFDYLTSSTQSDFSSPDQGYSLLWSHLSNTVHASLLSLFCPFNSFPFSPHLSFPVSLCYSVAGGPNPCFPPFFPRTHLFPRLTRLSFFFPSASEALNPCPGFLPKQQATTEVGKGYEDSDGY